jgi:outer membrane protein assembly factor BamB
VAPLLAAGNMLLVAAPESSAPVQHTILRAFNLADGSQRWQQTLTHALVSGMAAAYRGRAALVATVSTDLMHGNGGLAALDARGQVRWRWGQGVKRVSAPALVENTACFVADNRNFVVVDAATGIEKVRTELPFNASLAAPAVAGGMAYIPCQSQHLVAVTLAGQQQWHFEASQTPDAWLHKTPVVSGEQVVAVLGNGTVVALRRGDGSLIRPPVRVGPADKRLSAPATDGQRLYVGSYAGLHALDLVTGREVWAFSTRRRIRAAPVVIGDLVYATAHDHHLYVLDAATGREQWRYAAARRLEIGPAIAPQVKPDGETRIFIMDQGGTLTSLSGPLSAACYEAAGQWVKAALAHAEMGQFAAGARLLESHEEPFKAAQLWQAAGQLEQAAKQYEMAQAWPRAAELWGQLGELLKQAEALKSYALSIVDGALSNDAKAEAWVAAAQAFDAAGDIEQVAACQLKVAELRRQPVIRLAAEYNRLVQRAWSTLRFTVHNQGYGPAYNLIIQASGDQFEGTVAETRQMRALPAGAKRTDELGVCPLDYGDSVPLRVSVGYTDHQGQIHTLTETLRFPVARTEAPSQVSRVSDVFAAAPTPSSYNTAAIRDLLTAALTDQQILALAFDSFPDAYEQMNSSMGKDRLIQILLEYCRRHLKIDELLERVRDENPEQYALHAPRLKTS